jgi:hypothetical protein
MRRLVGAGLVVLLAFTLSGCSDDGGSEAADASTTTTSKAEADDTTTTVAELSDDEFEGVTDEFGGKVESASGDFCELIAASAFSPESAPANPDQVKAAVDEVVTYFRELARAEGVDEATATTLNSLADDLQASAEASGYSLEFLNSQQTTELFQSSDYVNAMGTLLARSEQECGGASPPGGG